MTELYNYERSPPEKAGKRFYTRNDGIKNKAVLTCATALGRERVLIDPIAGRGTAPPRSRMAASEAAAIS